MTPTAELLGEPSHLLGPLRSENRPGKPLPHPSARPPWQPTPDPAFRRFNSRKRSPAPRRRPPRTALTHRPPGSRSARKASAGADADRARPQVRLNRCYGMVADPAVRVPRMRRPAALRCRLHVQVRSRRDDVEGAARQPLTQGPRRARHLGLRQERRGDGDPLGSRARSDGHCDGTALTLIRPRDFIISGAPGQDVQNVTT
jgi:hypothetical protein